MYRVAGDEVEVLLGHPGGPYFARKDRGSWTVPKGLVDPQEPELEAARREFREETGLGADGLPSAGDDYLDLGEVRLAGGKRVRAWAFEGDCDPETLESNPFEIEWPPRSGRRAQFPEIDRYEFLALDLAADAIAPAQRPFLERLASALLATRKKEDPAR